jgi:hypothetical protein
MTKSFASGTPPFHVIYVFFRKIQSLWSASRSAAVLGAFHSVVKIRTADPDDAGSTANASERAATGLDLPALVVAADRRKWDVWPIPKKRLAVEIGAKPAGGTGRRGRMMCFHRDVRAARGIAECANGRHRQDQ